MAPILRPLRGKRPVRVFILKNQLYDSSNVLKSQRQANQMCFQMNQLSTKTDLPTKPADKRRENPIFTIWVHAGYVVLILSTIAWIALLEFWI